MDNAGIVNGFEFSGGYVDHMEQSTFEEALNKARADERDLILAMWQALYAKHCEHELTYSDNAPDAEEMAKFIKEMKEYLEE